MASRARMRLRLVLAALSALVSAAAHAAAPANPADALLYVRLCGQVAAAYDSSRGGWVTKGGEPLAAAVALGFAQSRDHGPAFWKTCALGSVGWTWTLYDSVGGGFYQKLANTRSDSQTFEKRTDSNAERLENLVEACRATGDPVLRRHAAQVADFFERVLLDGRGGFVDGQVGDRDLVPRSTVMATRAWFQWAALTGEPRVRDFALLSLDRAWKECWTAPYGMLRRGTFGEIEKVPQLTDQVEMGRAYVLGAHIGGRAGDLKRAETIGELIETVFADAKKGCWKTQAAADKKGRIKNAACDPLENARAALFFCELASVTGQPRWRDAARRAIASYAGDFGRAGLEAADWALAVRALDGADLPARPEWKAPPQDKPQQRVKSYGRAR
jgi:uncharacterized protein YyaL (SSP411 family)